MRILFYTVSIISVFGFGVLSNAQDSTSKLAERLELAKQYSVVVPVQDEIEKSIESMVVQMPKEDRLIFESILKRTIKPDQITAVSEMALADIFTKEELELMVTFYSSPEGRSIKWKMPQYMDRIQPTVQQMIRDAIDIYSEQKR